MTTQTHTPADVPAKTTSTAVATTSQHTSNDGRGATTVADGVVAKMAVDVTLVVEYPNPLQQFADNARDAVYTAVEDLVGMEVTEVNITITDIHVPSDDADADDAEREPRVA